MPTPEFYPALNELIGSDKVPEPLKSGIDSVFSKLFYKSYYVEKSVYGDTAYHHLVLVFKKVGFNLFGGAEGFELIFNPSDNTSVLTELPLSLYYNLPILKYARKIKLEDLSSVDDYFDLILEMFNIRKNDILFEAIQAFFEDVDNPAQAFIYDFNNNPDYSTYSPLTLPEASEDFDDEYTIVESLISQFEDNSLDIKTYLLETYISTSDITVGFEKLSLLFKKWLGEFSLQTLINLFIPKFKVSIDVLEIGLAFPRTWLQPVDDNYNVITDVNFKSMLIYNIGSVSYDSESGFEFNNLGTFTLTRSQIAKTGLIIEIDNVKLDFNSDKNIPEADADGRPVDFKGIYCENAAITLPKKWFHQDTSAAATLQLAAKKFLVGTEGGFSGEIALIPVGGTTPPADAVLWYNLGGNATKNWRIGFKSFDISFKQNEVINSHLHAQLELKKFKKPGESTTALIDLYGEWESKDNFKLSASFLPDGLPLNLFDLLIITFQTAEIGEENGDFFIGADTKLSFIEGTLAHSLFNGKEIDLPAIRFYFDGRFEVVGGNSFIPVNFTLPLFGHSENGKSNFEMSVTGIHLGSIQRERNGKLRKYNFIGFDGGISINPIGLDVRGKGVKYYYTTDSDEIYNEFGAAEGHDEEYYRDSYFHISTLELELVIPGNAKPEDVVAIIKGSLTIPEPGVSKEYSGEISLQLPKANIYGSASMRLNPAYPSYYVDASVEFPVPIPLGPIGINGFRGVIGQRYVAEKKAIGMVETDKWYDYYMAPQRGINKDKFSGPEATKDYDNPFSVGLGATISSMDGGGRIASLRAMMLLSVPSLFAIDAGLTILSERLGLAEDDPTTPPFYAFVLIGDDSLELGASANFMLNKSNGWLLDIKAQIEAGFFFKNQLPWYIHFGTPLKPINATVLKEMLSLHAQSFLMLSAKGIEAGARIDFDLDFFIAKLHASIEVGAYISFERPQVGGYVKIDGSMHIDFWVFDVYANIHVYLSVELPKPFLIFAEIKLRVCVRIGFGWASFKVCVKLKFTLKWQKNNTMVYTPIPALTYQAVNDPDFAKVDQTMNFVKGINMLTFETFDLEFFGVNTGEPDHALIDKIIPLDTYIDIKVEKGLNPAAISNKIGGHTGGAINYIDLVPPKQTLKGNTIVRQVKHKYSIEQLEIKAWSDSKNVWIDYHPYKAIIPEYNNVNNLKIGFWQKNSKQQYDTIRLLATNPFSFLDGAEPGWFIPEQYGITPSELFCTEESSEIFCSNVLNKELGTVYYPNPNSNSYQINGACYNIKGYFEVVVDPDLGDGDVTNQVYANDSMTIDDVSNPHNFAKSIVFRNSNTLVITLPESSVYVNLKITTNAQGATVKYYRTAINDSSIFQTFELIEAVHKTKAELASQLIFDNTVNYDNLRNVFKIEIIPDFPDSELINSIEDQIAELMNNSEEALDGLSSVVLHDEDLVLYNQLNAQLNELKSVGCTSLDAVPCDKDDILCDLYENIKELFNNCFKPLSVETVYQYCDKLECFDQFIKAIEIFNQQNPNYHLIDTYLDYIKKYQTDLEQLKKWCQNHNGKQEDVYNFYTSFVANAFYIVNSVRDLGHCDCGGETNCNKDEKLCALYDNLQTIYHDCFLPLSVETAYQCCPEIDCFSSYIKFIQEFDKFNPSYHLIANILGDNYNNYINQLNRLTEKCNSEHNDSEGMYEEYIPFLSTASNILQTIGEFGDCNCEDNSPCQKDMKLCDFYNYLLGVYADCFKTLSQENIYDYSKEIECFHNFIGYLQAFNADNPQYNLLQVYIHDQFEEYLIQLNQLIVWWNNKEKNTAMVLAYYNSFLSNTYGMISAISDLGNCNCTGTGISDCTTSFQSVCWKTLEHYEYQQTIPTQDAVQLDTSAMIEGIQATAQPIWRPNTKYYVKFRLRDEVDNGQRPAGSFDYFYGFRTVGPVGHFHKYPNAYPIPATSSVTEYPLTSLNKYIDYTRSYPNADGDLILAKPLFYGNEQCKIDIYFAKAFAYHMFNTWPAYDINTTTDNIIELPEIKGAMHIAIKDPITGVIIPYPLPQDWGLTDTVPETVGNGANGVSWVNDLDPRIPHNIQILNNYINLVNANSNAIHCEIDLGDPIRPASYTYSITLTNLKPRKLYTAQVYNAFDENGDGLIANQLDANGVITYEESQKVHEFVFQTSRYAHFREQVESYKLKEYDDLGALLNQKDAVFEFGIYLTSQQVADAYALVSGGSSAQTLALETQFYHDFDRVVEGIFGMKPIDPPTTTDFVKILNTENGNVVALLVRNPEPFNNPRIPLDLIKDSIEVVTAGSVNLNYKVLFSKDYSQALIMQSSTIISGTISIRFKYRIWNGISFVIPNVNQITLAVIDPTKESGVVLINNLQV